MSYQTKTMTRIKDPIEIIQGSTIEDLDCTLQDIVVAYETATGDSDEFTSDVAAGDEHHLVRLWDIAEAAFTQIISNVSTNYSAAAETPVMVMYNLGRLAREVINDDTFLKILKSGLPAELRTKLSDGATATHAATTYSVDVASMWFAMGQGSNDMFGDWSRTEWKPADDAIAGVWLTVFYVLFHWGVQVCTWMSKDHARGIGEYVSQGGALEGRLKKLDIFDEADWPLRYLYTYNAVGDVFGITTGVVDNEFLKGIEVPILDTVEPFIQKYFSRSRWLWRYMRWVDVTPIYTCLHPSTSAKNSDAVSAYTDLSFMALFDSVADRCDWDWWNNKLVTFVQKLQKFKFRGSNGAAFGKLKSRIKLTPVFEVPEPGQGDGGLFWHQMTSGRVDEDVGGDDNYLLFKHHPIKEGSDLDYTPSGTPDVLQLRRDINQYKFYQLIGDVTPEMFQFIIGSHITQVATRKDIKDSVTPTYLVDASLDTDTNRPDYYNLPFSPAGIITFTVEKDEVEGYYLNPAAQSYTFEFFEDDSGYTCFSYPCAVHDWGNVLEITGGNSVYSEGEPDVIPNEFYDMRSSDPYKKLKHICYDLNTLDAVAIRNVMSQTYLGTAPAEDVAISAKITTPISQRKDGSDDGTHNEGSIPISIEGDVNHSDPKETYISAEEDIKDDPDEFKISVTAEQIKKEEKKLKDLKDKLAKQKKKDDAKAKADADKKKKSEKK